jgi:hypothetical protein
LQFGLRQAPQWSGRLAQHIPTMPMEGMSLAPPVAMEIIATPTVIDL